MVEWFRSLTPQQLVLLNALIVTLLILYFRSGKPRKPTRLKMGGEALKGPGAIATVAATDSPAPAGPPPQEAPARAKSLNVIFMYNQHSFDAYEILGVPAGSSYAVVKEAYDDLLRELPGDKRPLVEAAFQAIQEDRKGP